MEIGSEQWRQLIIDGGQDMGVHVSDAQADLFSFHAKELLIWNRKTNLTAITEPVDIAEKHFLDAIAAVPMIPGKGRLLDLGSGGGFPGVPLKIMKPSLHVTLVDASRKKIHFLKNLIRQSGLQGIEALRARSEQLARMETYRGGFDIVTARAFRGLDLFVAEALPFLSRGGMLLAYMGKIEQWEQEKIEAAFRKKWERFAGNGVCLESLKITHQAILLPVSETPRNFIVIRI